MAGRSGPGRLTRDREGCHIQVLRVCGIRSTGAIGGRRRMNDQQLQGDEGSPEDERG